MKEIEIKQYLDAGYVIAPLQTRDHLSETDEIEAITLDEETIRNIFVNAKPELEQVFSDYKLFLIKWDRPYVITSDDLLELFENLKSGEVELASLKSWVSFLTLTTLDNKPLYIPFLNSTNIKDKYYDDCFYENDEHIVHFMISVIRQAFENNETLDFDKFIAITKELKNPSPDRIYSDDTQCVVLGQISFAMSVAPLEIMDSTKDYFYEQLNRLVNKDVTDALMIMGYLYYEGDERTEVDFKKSLYYLEKAYFKNQEPDLARTIGYIYYYGRHNNGIPDETKAFQYFAIGHFAGHFYEASYKLADCYLKGYGTPVSHKAAYNIIEKLFGESKFTFLNNRDGKFADIALRLASCYENGIAIDKSLRDAHNLYLQAREAIKKRLSEMDYVGDRHVAYKISESLKRVEEQLDIPDRDIKLGGYVLDNPELIRIEKCLINIEKYDDEYFKLSATPLNLPIHLLVEEKIGFAEVTNKIEYLFKVNDIDSVTSIANNAITTFTVFEGDIYITYKDDDNREYNYFTRCLEAIVLPQNMTTLEKEYILVNVSFPGNEKTYKYLSDDRQVKIGDTLFVNEKGETKEVIVKSISHIYEDQIHLPHNKLLYASKKIKKN